MLHKLTDNGETLWSTDPEKRTIIFEKYKQYQVPVCILFSSFLISIFQYYSEKRNRLDWFIA
jgi:hypothetical protein